MSPSLLVAANAPPSHTAAAAFTRATTWRIILAVGTVLALASAHQIGHAWPARHVAADLTLLLRGMALIKGAFALSALGILAWRVCYPLSLTRAWVYCSAAWGATAASVLVWQLAAIPLAALLFHGSEIVLLVCAWNDTEGAAAWSSLRAGRPRSR